MVEAVAALEAPRTSTSMASMSMAALVAVEVDTPAAS